MNRNIFSNMKDGRTVTIREKTEARGPTLVGILPFLAGEGRGVELGMYNDVGEKDVPCSISWQGLLSWQLLKRRDFSIYGISCSMPCQGLLSRELL
jgi:hypothetical protein